MARMAEKADEQAQIEAEPTTFAVFGHCASGYRELWDVVDTIEQARKLARRTMVKHPVTPCGTGGVVWVEVFGPGIEESLGFERRGDLVVETGG